MSAPCCIGYAQLVPVEGGLAPALDNLVAFWRARQPTIRYSIDVSVDEDGIDDPTLAAIYRLVQEGLNNAVRHGRPERIEIAVQPMDSGEIVVRVADDGTGLAESGPPGSGFVGLGFRGMRERVEGLGGSLRVGPGENGKGLVVTARLPSIVAMEAA